jgi:NAD(P)-dependent dehydrogenase (short-subunit alcohol dehydrogenase family)
MVKLTKFCIAVMAVKAYTKSADNIELQFAANHIGHFLLTNLLLPKIVAAKGRVVNVSSQGYMCGGIAWEDVNFHVSVHSQV